jgi:hypothetical protein
VAADEISAAEREAPSVGCDQDQIAGADEPGVGPSLAERIGEGAESVTSQSRLFESFLPGELGHAATERSEELAGRSQGGD